MRLDRARILAAALKAVDRDGLHALSMRSLGATLGVEAMSLYKHFPDKAAIVDGLAWAALDEIGWETEQEEPWQRRIEALTLGLRAVGLRHPDAFRLLAAGPALGRASLRPLEAILTALTDGGFTRAHAVSVMWTIASYVLGAVTGELAERERARRPERRRGPVPEIENFPNVAAAAELLEGCDFEDELLAGLRRILAGAVAESRGRRRRGERNRRQ